MGGCSRRLLRPLENQMARRRIGADALVRDTSSLDSRRGYKLEQMLLYQNGIFIHNEQRFRQKLALQVPQAA